MVLVSSISACNIANASKNSVTTRRATRDVSHNYTGDGILQVNAGILEFKCSFIVEVGGNEWLRPRVSRIRVT